MTYDTRGISAMAKHRAMNVTQVAHVLQAPLTYRRYEDPLQAELVQQAAIAVMQYFSLNSVHLSMQCLQLEPKLAHVVRKRHVFSIRVRHGCLPHQK